jgi:hypothetical protein
MFLNSNVNPGPDLTGIDRGHGKVGEHAAPLNGTGSNAIRTRIPAVSAIGISHCISGNDFRDN